MVAGQQQPVEQLKENSEKLLLSSPHEHRQRWLFAFPLLVALRAFFALPSICSTSSFATLLWAFAVAGIAGHTFLDAV